MAAVTLALVRAIAVMRDQIGVLEARIIEQLAVHPDGHLFTSLPRSGRVRAAALLAGHLPLHVRQEAAGRAHRLPRGQPPRQSLGGRPLRPGACPLQDPSPRRAHPRAGLDQRGLALLAGRCGLRPGASSGAPAGRPGVGGMTEGAARAVPSRHDGVTMACPVCRWAFVPVGRQRYCTDACRAAAHRRRQAVAPRVPITVYECGTCGERAVGMQRCDGCSTFMRRVGTGGACPGCDEAITVAELLARDIRPWRASATGQGHPRSAAGQEG
jgi:hypothetical protein